MISVSVHPELPLLDGAKVLEGVRRVPQFFAEFGMEKPRLMHEVVGLPIMMGVEITKIQIHP